MAVTLVDSDAIEANRPIVPALNNYGVLESLLAKRTLVLLIAVTFLETGTFEVSKSVLLEQKKELEMPLKRTLVLSVALTLCRFRRARR